MFQKDADLIVNDQMFAALSPESIAKVCAIVRRTKIKKGQVIYRRGEAPSGLLRVVTGRIRVGASTAAGNEFLLTTLLPGDWFGEISILDGKPRTHDAVALENSELLLLPLVDLRRLCAQYADLNSVIVGLLCAHIRAAFNAIDDFLLLNPEQRLAKRVLELLAKQAGAQQTNERRVTMSQQDLSELMNLSRQSINKLLKNWERQGTIKRVYRGFEVRLPQQLEALLSAED